MERLGILALCYANICRSPMAEALIAREIEAQGQGDRFYACSAGFLVDGRNAHPFSIQCMKARGLDILDHRSRILTPMQISQTAVILSMEEKLADRARALGAEEVYNLQPYATLGANTDDVSDPIGKDLPAFEACAKLLEELLPKALERVFSEFRAR